MTTVPAEWTATISLHVSEPRVEEWVERALRPEAAREVPRSSAEVRRGPGGDVTVVIAARDSGAMRAALNTYLGWIHLALASAYAARSPLAGSPAKREPSSRSS